MIGRLLQFLGAAALAPLRNEWTGFPLLPQAASSYAERVDVFYFFMVGISVVLAGGIALVLVLFSIRYRKGARVNRRTDEGPAAERKRLWLEITWSAIPLGIVIVMFIWGSMLYFQSQTPPPDAMNIAVTAKQWMWKFQHPNGRREINALHLPAGQAVKLTMTSQDVIHSFFVPVFRVKQDVLPNRYTVLWFRPTKPGSYHLFCAEYCGTNHALMRGTVVVMEPAEYQRWLTQGDVTLSMARQGEQLFQQQGCSGCHMPGPGQVRQGPNLSGLFGRPVRLADGSTVIADRQYIHDSIVLPQKDLVAGFQPVMPTFQGVLSEDQINTLIEYIKSLEGADTSVEVVK